MHFVSLAMTFASSVILLFDVTNHVPQTKQNKTNEKQPRK